MKFQEILIIVVGAIAFIWAIIGLNNFIGGSPLMLYLGTPVAIGGFIIIVGGLVYFYVADHVGA